MSLRNKCAQSGECEFCREDIVRHTNRQLWRSTSSSLSTHDPEYCPDSPNHSHKLAATKSVARRSRTVVKHQDHRESLQVRDLEQKILKDFQTST